MNKYIENKLIRIDTDNNVVSIIGLINDNILIGFISLFKNDCNERNDLTPWYATMYVKKEYRGKGYPKVLNNGILKDAKRLGYNKIYLKTELINYYEKFGAKFVEKLTDKGNLYCFDI